MEGIVTDFDDELNGIVVDERGTRVSIPGAIIGEKIRYHLEHVSPHEPRAWGRCDALLESSSDRVKTPCHFAWPTAGSCAGCPIMHMDYDLQLQLKSQYVLRCLQKSGIIYIKKVTCTPSKDRLRYRNRTDLVAAEIRGKLVLGSYKPRSHSVLPTRTCMVLRPPLNQVLNHIVEAANKLSIPAATQGVQFQGALRYVSLFANDQAKVVVDLVCKSAGGNAPSWLRRFADEISRFVSVIGVTYSINDSPNNALRVAPSKLLWGQDRIPERHGKITSLFTASGFTQLNTDVAADVYKTARNWLQGTPDTVWDLYCGAGAFGRFIAPGKALYGAEFNTPAIEAARKVSQSDPFTTTFEVMDLEKNWPSHWPTPNLILVDPPRKGLSRLILRKLAETHVPTIIYMSCNPETFAQNIASLSSHYVLEQIQAFDMMPQTRHVEVLGLLRHI